MTETRGRARGRGRLQRRKIWRKQIERKMSIEERGRRNEGGGGGGEHLELGLHPGRGVVHRQMRLVPGIRWEVDSAADPLRHWGGYPTLDGPLQDL